MASDLRPKEQIRRSKCRHEQDHVFICMSKKRQLFVVYVKRRGVHRKEGGYRGEDCTAGAVTGGAGNPREGVSDHFSSTHVHVYRATLPTGVSSVGRMFGSVAIFAVFMHSLVARQDARQLLPYKLSTL